MIKVKSRAGESIQQMVKRFKKMCEKEGLIRDIKRNGYYEKPSEKNAANAENLNGWPAWSAAARPASKPFRLGTTPSGQT